LKRFRVKENTAKILERKEQLASELDADWFMHADPDEVRLPPKSGQTLAEAFTEVDHQGFNAVNFTEFTFVPTRQSPDHDHPNYLQTMRWYYPYLPSFPHRLNAWKKQAAPAELAWSGGHQVRFPGLHMYPTSFPSALPVPRAAHAMQKYLRQPIRRTLPADASGACSCRNGFFCRTSRVAPYASDDLLDASPLRRAPALRRIPKGRLMASTRRGRLFRIAQTVMATSTRIKEAAFSKVRYNLD
jgi:hypothetical protein